MSQDASRAREELDAPLAQVMSTDLLEVNEETTILETAIEMRSRRVAYAVVLSPSGEKVEGIITERDVLMAVVAEARDPSTTTVGEIMTREVSSLDGSVPISVAADLINSRGFRHVPITVDGKVAGIVSMRDVFRIRLRHMEQLLDNELRALQELQQMLGLDPEERVQALLEVNQRLRQLSLTDELTGLFNHRYFRQRLDQEVARAQRSMAPFVLVIADLDHFKRINDTYGHPVGDRVLQAVGQGLRETVEGSKMLVRLRKSDVVTRYGGEEFAVLLLDSRANGGLIVAERLRKAVSSLSVPLPDGGSLNVTASFGVASFPEHASSAQAVLRAADAALYRAKEGGRNRVECAPAPAS